MPHWTEEINHDKLNDAPTKEAFTKAYGKYNTIEEGLLGGMEAMKSVGQPYKLPESLDKLPSDEIRTGFMKHVGKLLGAVEKEEDLKDINWTDGMDEGAKANEELINSFGKFAVQEGLPKQLVNKIAKLNNIMGKQLLPQLIEAAKKKDEAERKAKADAVHKALVEAHNGDENALKQETELVRRLFKDHAGLNSKDYEDAAIGLIDSGITQSATLSKALGNIARQIVKEGITNTPGSPGKDDKKPKTAMEKLKESVPSLAKAIKGES